jgi:hypothetical protein
MNRLFAVLLLWALGHGAAADPRPLQLEAVLASSLRAFPQILAALEKQEAQSGKLLASQGAFDLQLENTTYPRAAG